MSLKNQEQCLSYGHYTGKPALADTPSSELEDFIGVKFYCPLSLADNS